MSGLGTLALACLLAAAGADDDPTTQQARTYNAAARRSFAAGDYVSALRDFERAYQLKPDPRLRLNLAVTLETMARLDEASEQYELFLREMPENDKADAVRDSVAQLQKRMTTWGKLIIEVTPSPALVTVGGLAFTAPAVRWFPAGTLKLTAQKDGYRATAQEVDLQPAQRQVVQLVLEPLEAAAPVAAAPQPAPATDSQTAAPPDDGAGGNGGNGGGAAKQANVLPWSMVVVAAGSGAVAGLALLVSVLSAVGGVALFGLVAAAPVDKGRPALDVAFYASWAVMGVGLLVAALATAAVGVAMAAFVVMRL